MTKAFPVLAGRRKGSRAEGYPPAHYPPLPTAGGIFPWLDWLIAIKTMGRAMDDSDLNMSILLACTACIVAAMAVLPWLI